MAFSTIGTKFEYSQTEMSTGGGTEVRIKSYPDPIGAPNSIDVTDMQDTQFTTVPGLKGSAEAMDFTANFDAATYKAINQLTDEVYQRLTLPDGTKFDWKGKLTVSLSDGAVNSVAEMTLHSYKSGDVTPTFPS